MKYYLLFPLLLVAACNDPQPETKPTVMQQHTSRSLLPDGVHATQTPAIPRAQLIEPGKQLGNTPLGEDVEVLIQRLGGPDLADAAMGKEWLTWKGGKDEHNNHTELNIYATYADSTMMRKTVQQIRTTSSYFKTSDGLGVYSAYADLLAQFPKLKKVGSYEADGRTITIYDARDKGIAFELAPAGAEQICTGVILHEPGQNVLDIYLYWRPELVRTYNAS